MSNNEALSGIRVLEYADLISGPYCAKLMADLGAKVIKIEPPATGDPARHLGPFRNDLPHPERGGLFHYLNTNKKGITLNLQTSTGLKLFKDLVKISDVLIENKAPRVMEELGLVYNELSKINPKLVMVSIIPFGQTGPYRDYKSNELVTLHMSGIGYETPRATDPRYADCPPLKAGGYFSGFFAALNAAGAMMVALYARRADGLGQHIDISEQECLVPLMRRPLAIYCYEGRMTTRFMYTWVVAPHHFMRCKDGFIFASVVEDHQWINLLEVMGNPDWGKDPRFCDGAARLENWNALEPLLSAWLMERTKAEIWNATQAKGVPFAPVNTMKDLIDSPQLKAREFFAGVEHPEVGKITLPSPPYKFSETAPRIEKGAPLLGEHNKEVYVDLLGRSRAELTKMRGTGVI